MLLLDTPFLTLFASKLDLLAQQLDILIFVAPELVSLYTNLIDCVFVASNLIWFAQQLDMLSLSCLETIFLLSY